MNHTQLHWSQWDESFPWFLDEDDQPAMLHLCREQLETWRRAKSYHRSLPTAEARMADRVFLEACYSDLCEAWQGVQSAAVAA